MTQVKEIQSISNTNRIVKVLLQALEVGDCTVHRWVKRKKIWYMFVQRLRSAVTSSTTLVGMQC